MYWPGNNSDGLWDFLLPSGEKGKCHWMPHCNPGTGLAWPGLPGSPGVSSYCRWKEPWGPHYLKRFFKVILPLSCRLWFDSPYFRFQNHLHPLSTNGSKKFSTHLVPQEEIIYRVLPMLAISKSFVFNCPGQCLACGMSVWQINVATKEVCL